MLQLLALSALSGAASYLEQQEQERAAKNKAAAISKAFQDSMLTKAEIAFRADQVGDTFDSAMQDTANAAAVSARSVLNPNVVKTLSMAKIQSQKLQAITQQRMNDENANRDLMLKSRLAKTEGIIPNMTLPAAFAGGLQGIQLGMNFKSMLTTNDLYDTETRLNKKKLGE